MKGHAGRQHLVSCNSHWASTLQAVLQILGTLFNKHSPAMQRLWFTGLSLSNICAWVQHYYDLANLNYQPTFHPSSETCFWLWLRFKFWIIEQCVLWILKYWINLTWFVKFISQFFNFMYFESLFIKLFHIITGENSNQSPCIYLKAIVLHAL